MAATRDNCHVDNKLLNDDDDECFATALLEFYHEARKLPFLCMRGKSFLKLTKWVS